MKRAASILLSFIFAVALAGCGGGAGTTSTPKPGQPLDPQGNWLFSFAGRKPITLAGALFELTPPNVTSQSVQQTDPTEQCFGLFTFTGQASGTNSITFSLVQSGNLGGNGDNLTLNGTIADDQAHMSGTWALNSGSTTCWDGTDTSGTWTAQLLTAATGNWSGTVALGNNETLTVTAALTEVTDQTSDMGHVSGTVTVSGQPCFATPVTFNVPTTINESGVHEGELLQLNTDTQNGVSLNITGQEKPDGTSIAVPDFKIVGGVCDSGNGPLFSGTLAHQP